MEHISSKELYFSNFNVQKEFAAPIAFHQFFASRIYDHNRAVDKPNENNFMISYNNFITPNIVSRDDMAFHRRGSVTLLKESFLKWNPTTPSAADIKSFADFTPMPVPLPEEPSYINTTTSFASLRATTSPREEYEKNLLNIEDASKKKKYTHRMSKQASQALEAWLLDSLNEPELVLTPETRRLFQKQFNLSGKQLTNWLYYAHKKRERLLKEREAKM
eukprot:CAMPEP_0168561928 /NCGR_PEP_ID=MMETSP0413-20121227/11856_1 /TAXON_ID=136452 /ORGANISM="Filamoeba nolandi, Strain NC-AS-23-1" /LENGTH=218 /DNA_ID=CAMNT_0008593331 /DNA_START=200 /DNA_END=856 /DNA_ORIENTATION=-